MTRITQKQIIGSLKELKDIKPRQEWAVLLKSQILSPKLINLEVPERIIKEIPAKSIGILDILSVVFFQRKLAYVSMLALLLVIGFFGFAQNTVPGDLLFPLKEIAEQSQAALTGRTTLNQDVANLKGSINNLAQAAKDGKKDNIPSAIKNIDANALVLANNLRNNSVNDPQTLNEIGQTLNKTLADIPGTDLTETPGVQDLLQILIADYQKITLTDDQKDALADAEDLYAQEKYADALEKILLINENK